MTERKPVGVTAVQVLVTEKPNGNGWQMDLRHGSAQERYDRLMGSLLLRVFERLRLGYSKYHRPYRSI